MTPAIHWRLMADFTRFERAVGGPDPHMVMAAHIGRRHTDPVKRAWVAGCYVGPYNIPAFEALLHHYPTAASVADDPPAWRRWVADNWHRLHLRRERRAIRTPGRFADHMAAYARWCLTDLDAVAALTDGDAVWNALMRIPGNGRYGTLKLYEILYRLDVVRPAFPDIRPRDGRTPRDMLAMLYPLHTDTLRGGNRAADLHLTNAVAADARLRLEAALDSSVDWYTLEVVLCEYRQAWGGGQYPGRAHDSELGHYHKTAPFWPEVDFEMLTLRRRLFPVEALGEVNGWDGRRKELGTCPATYGYVWSDLAYTYPTDLANPQPRV